MTSALDGVGGRPLSQTGGDSAPTRDADAKAGERFDDLIRDGRPSDRQNGEGGAGDQPGGGGGQEQPAPNPFSLFGGALPTPPTFLAAPLAAPSPEQSAAPRQVAALIEAVAERVLVSEGGHDGPAPEVRIQIKDSLLPATEIRIREEGGRMVVEFVSANADAVRFLDGQRDALMAGLDGRLKAEVEVRVTASDGTEAGADSGGDPQGRSRQTYVTDDESGENPA